MEFDILFSNENIKDDAFLNSYAIKTLALIANKGSSFLFNRGG